MDHSAWVKIKIKLEVSGGGDDQFVDKLYLIAFARGEDDDRHEEEYSDDGDGGEH